MKIKKKIPLLALGALLVGMASLSAAPKDAGRNNFCRCVPRCPSGYFCEQDGLGGCFCSPI
jgi:hypothetical protein